MKGLFTNFDVSTGGLDSAQEADSIGVCILDILSRVSDSGSICLIKDDGLVVIPEINGPKINRIHKKLTKAFVYQGFKVDITSKTRIANRLHDCYLHPEVWILQPLLEG